MRVLIIREGGLSRVMQHVKSGSHATLSAHRGGRTSRENRVATKRMGKAIRRMGYGFKKVTGRGQETDPKTGKTVVSKEKSFFVPGMKKKMAKRLGRAFKQDFVVHGSKGKAALHPTAKKAKPVAKWKKTTPKPAQFSTQVGKKHFHYEACQITVHRRQ